MGIRIEDLSERQKAMIEGAETPPSPRATILGRRPRLERDEQGIFANWLLSHRLPYCWHSTHRRTTATVGVYDFWVGKDGWSAWFEFKQLPVRLSKEQVEFGNQLAAQKIEAHVVLSADEAIKIVKGWADK